MLLYMMHYSWTCEKVASAGDEFMKLQVIKLLLMTNAQRALC